MNYKKLIYKRKYSLCGAIIVLCVGAIHITYNIAKWSLINIYKFIRWFIRYIHFAKAGYSYNEIYNIIKDMDGRTFEVFIAELFKASGKYYRVQLTSESNDGGKDIILYGSDGVTYVETKRWNEHIEIGRVLLQKLCGSATADKVDNMIFVTTSFYNKNALEYAAKLDNLELWDITDIMRLVTKIDQKKIPVILAKTLSKNSKIIKLNPISN